MAHLVDGVDRLGLLGDANVGVCQDELADGLAHRRVRQHALSGRRV
jgi:hypothetical protein